MTSKLFKICFYVPEKDLEKVKSALFAAGAGRYDNYDSCCWQTLGEGQFRPLKGSNPHIGTQDKIEKVPEYKVEMVCKENLLAGAIAALKNAHPYEEPAYEVYSILT